MAHTDRWPDTCSYVIYQDGSYKNERVSIIPSTHDRYSQYAYATVYRHCWVLICTSWSTPNRLGNNSSEYATRTTVPHSALFRISVQRNGFKENLSFASWCNFACEYTNTHGRDWTYSRFAWGGIVCRRTIKNMSVGVKENGTHRSAMTNRRA